MTGFYSASNNDNTISETFKEWRDFLKMKSEEIYEELLLWELVHICTAYLLWCASGLSIKLLQSDSDCFQARKMGLRCAWLTDTLNNKLWTQLRCSATKRTYLPTGQSYPMPTTQPLTRRHLLTGQGAEWALSTGLTPRCLWGLWTMRTGKAVSFLVAVGKILVNNKTILQIKPDTR